jgi:hypothetical protein
MLVVKHAVVDTKEPTLALVGKSTEASKVDKPRCPKDYPNTASESIDSTTTKTSRP